MTTLDQRFAELQAAKPEISQADLARATGVKPPSVSDWFTGNTKSMKIGTAAKAAALYGVNALWLAVGEGPKFPATQVTTGNDQKEKSATNSISNISAARAYSGEVPVINWVQAGAWQEVAEAVEPERYLPIFRGHSSNSYALRVRGDSMTAAHGKSYPDGCFIIVDPAKVSPVNGDRVVARLKGVAEATFKIFKNEDGQQWLAPLNQMHKPIYDGFTVVGTVIGKWEDE